MGGEWRGGAVIHQGLFYGFGFCCTSAGEKGKIFKSDEVRFEERTQVKIQY